MPQVQFERDSRPDAVGEVLPVNEPVARGSTEMPPIDHNIDTKLRDPGPALTIATEEIHDAGDLVRRMSGLPWSGGEPETWEFRFYDAIPVEPDQVRPEDVMAANALHPNMSRQDRAFFVDRKLVVDRWLSRIPPETDLANLDPYLLAQLTRLRDWQGAPSLAVLTKVLHRLRPNLIPLVDRHVVDWYRLVTGERSLRGAWPGLIMAMSHDVISNHKNLKRIGDEVESVTGVRPTPLRLMDMAIWMNANRDEPAARNGQISRSDIHHGGQPSRQRQGR